MPTAFAASDCIELKLPTLSEQQKKTKAGGSGVGRELPIGLNENLPLDLRSDLPVMLRIRLSTFEGLMLCDEPAYCF